MSVHDLIKATAVASANDAAVALAEEVAGSEDAFVEKMNEKAKSLGMKETTLAEMMAKKPEKVVELAVKGMLPKGPLGREMYTKLFVYAGPEHKHAAQKPEVLTF